jgi:hypothetical protein
VVHQHIRLSEVIVTDILDSDHLPITFTFLDPVRMREALDQLKNRLGAVSKPHLWTIIVYPNIPIYSCKESDNATHDCVLYSLALGRRTTILDQIYETPNIDHLLKNSRKLRNWWKETRDQARKTAVNWVAQNIKRMVWKRALERQETKIAYCKVTPQAIRPCKKRWTKGTWNSWSFRPHTLSN